jgi:hypothetical protein
MALLILACAVSLTMLSSYSFIGWVADWVIVSVALTLVLRQVDTGWQINRKMFVRTSAAILVATYLFASYMFGPQVEKRYVRKGLTYTIYRIPDMVLYDTHDLEVHQNWGIIEKELLDVQIRNPKCIYEYDVLLIKLTAVNHCR